MKTHETNGEVEHLSKGKKKYKEEQDEYLGTKNYKSQN